MKTFNKNKLIAALALTASALTFNAQAGDTVYVSGNKSVSNDQIKALIINAESTNKSITEIAKEVLTLYKSKGYLATKISVDSKKGVILIKEPTVFAKGDYSEYMKSNGSLTVKDIKLAKLRMTRELENNNESIAFKLEHKDDKLAVLTGVKSADKSNKGSGYLNASNSGSKYTSSYVLSAGGNYKLGHGQRVGASISKGLSDLGESSGGDVKSGGLTYEKATEYGTFGAEFNYSEYEIGGDYQDFGINGETRKAALTHDYYLTSSLKLKTRLDYVSSSQQLKTFGMKSDYDFTALSVGGEYKDNQGMTANFAFEKGLNGGESYNISSLNGKFEEDFMLVKADIKQAIPLKTEYTDSLELSAGAQAGSDGTPGVEKFTVGGFGRGSSFSNGYKSAPTGLYAGIKAKKSIKGVELFAGVDGSIAYPLVGDSIDSKSAFMGARHYSKSTGVFVDGRLGHNIGDTVSGNDNDKLSLTITKLL